MIPHLGSELKNLVFLLGIQSPGYAALYGILNPSFVVICWHFAKQWSSVWATRGQSGLAWPGLQQWNKKCLLFVWNLYFSTLGKMSIDIEK